MRTAEGTPLTFVEAPASYVVVILSIPMFADSSVLSSQRGPFNHCDCGYD